jgi:mono/diheme cytochrome c family protein
MVDKMDKLHVRRRRFEGDDIADLVAFIRGDSTRPVELEMVYMQSATPRAGAMLFAKKGCARCHGADASGDTAPGLNEPGLVMTASDVAAAFWNHGAPMWARMKELGIPFPKFSDGEMSDLLAYLAFLQYAGREGDAKKGAQVFKDKSCTECHAVAGKGSQIAPDLVTPRLTASVVQWTAEMWNHEVAMEEKFKEKERPWPRFEDDEMRDLVAFLRSTGTPAEATQ